MDTALGYPIAESNCLLVAQLAHSVKLNFLKLGQALLINRENCYWQAKRYDTFKDFVEGETGLDYSWATRLMNVSKLIAAQKLTGEDVIEMGISKATLLLPAAKRGELTEEIIEQAKGAPYSELREQLTGKAAEIEQAHINCPYCGYEISNAKWVKHDKP